MTVLELCSLIRNPKHTEVIIYVGDSVDDGVVFTDSAYNAMLSNFANCEVFNFRPMNYTIIAQVLT
jgi:hypothetical protein